MTFISTTMSIAPRQASEEKKKKILHVPKVPRHTASLPVPSAPRCPRPSPAPLKVLHHRQPTRLIWTETTRSTPLSIPPPPLLSLPLTNRILPLRHSLQMPFPTDPQRREEPIPGKPWGAQCEEWVRSVTRVRGYDVLEVFLRSPSLAQGV